jgi:hypothetical protein
MQINSNKSQKIQKIQKSFFGNFNGLYKQLFSSINIKKIQEIQINPENSNKTPENPNKIPGNLNKSPCDTMLTWSSTVVLACNPH